MNFDSYEFFESTLINLEVKFRNDYRNVLDLGTSLIDFQAIISGFARIFEDDTFGMSKEYEFNTLIKNDENNIRTKRLKNLISYELPQIDPDKVEHLSTLIDMQYRPEKRVASEKTDTIRTYPTTSRRFSDRYKHLLILKEFRQGSLVLELATSVAAGLILKFIERLLFKGEEKLNVQINNNIIIIEDGSDKRKIIRIEDSPKLHNEHKYKSQTKINEYYDSIINAIQIEEDIEKSVLNFLNKMAEEKLLSKKVVYDKRGVKTLINDIERFRGNFFDVGW